MENQAVRSYVARRASEIFEQFGLVLNTVSLEEALAQAECAERPSETTSAAQAQPAKIGDDGMSDQSMDGQHR